MDDNCMYDKFLIFFFTLLSYFKQKASGIDLINQLCSSFLLKSTSIREIFWMSNISGIKLISSFEFFLRFLIVVNFVSQTSVKSRFSADQTYKRR